MTRIEIACYALIATAFMLAGILVVALDGYHAESAHANMVIARDNFTLMTANTRQTEEALFVLDNANARLLIYRLDLPRKQLLPIGAFSLQDLFRQGRGGSGGAGGDGNDGGGRRGR